MGAAKLPPPEIIESLGHSAYSLIDAEHSGVLRRILTSPLAYRVAKDQELTGVDEDRDTLRLGRGTHTAILEPGLFPKQYICWSGGTRRGKAWEEYETIATANHQTILKEDQIDACVAMSKAVRGHPIAGPLVTKPGRSELTIVWTHPRTGVKIKVRLDRLCDGVLLDLKSCRDPSPARFSTQAAQLGYHFQLALYADAAYAAGLGPVEAKIIAVQSALPHDVVVYSLDETVLSVGRDEYERALDLLVACRESGKWPGQAVDAEVPMHLPTWASSATTEIDFGTEVIGNIGATP